MLLPYSSWRGSSLPGGEFLRSGLDMAFDHDAKNGVRAIGHLLGNGLRHFGLALGRFITVGVAAIHHDAGAQPGRFERDAGGLHALRIVVGRFAAAQNDMTVLIAGRGNDCRMPALGHGEEVMRRLRSANRIDGDAHIAIGTILEPDRA